MRTPGEIKTELLKLRDLKHLPYSHITEHSRCSVPQIVSALKLEATEDVMRRLDAYLDATHLHVNKKHTEMLWRIEKLDNELYRVFGAKTIHILTVQDWSRDRQRRHLDAMDYRGKRLLKRTLELMGLQKIRFPDGLHYWKWKDGLCRRNPKVKMVLESGDANRLLREDPMGKSRFL